MSAKTKAAPKTAMPKAQDAATEAAAAAEIAGESYTMPYDAAGLDDEFATAVRNRQRLDAKIKELEEAKRGITEEIQALVFASGQKSVRVDNWKVTYSEGRKGSKKLEPKLLLEKGVPASVIAACTVEGEPGKPYVVVSAIKAS